MRFRDELQRLEALLHFPEEVALRLTEVEHKLFYSIEPVHYIRQVTIQLNSLNDLSTCESEANKSEKTLTVKQLIERFTEVSTWITHLIISQPTHEMRKAILSCIMRVVQTCWNLGNFNSAVEILAGLKSEKLKPFWLSIEQKDEPFLRKKLTDILLTLEEPSPEYQSAVIRALDIPHSKTIPFFGAFLRDLKTILQRMPSLIVLSSEPNKPPSLQSDRRKEATTKIDSISEFNGEDNYMSRIGVGGIINLGKMYKTHQVLDNIRTFHIHAIRRNQLIASLKCVPNNIWLVAPDDGSGRNRYYQLYCDQFVQNELSGRFEPKRSMSEESRGPQQQNKQQTSFPSINSIGSQSNKYEKEQLYQMEINCYKPIQLLPKSHGISVIPLDVHLIDYHNLQAMHHGMSAIHYEEDTGRSAVVFLQLEESNSTLMWCKPFWSTMLRSSGNAPQDYQLSLNIEDTILAGVMMKYETREAAMIALDEGFIDLMYLKDIVVGQTNVDLNVIARRHSLPEYILMESGNCSIKLQFGMNLSDNRTTEFIAPKNIATLWVDGLRSVLQLIQEQKKLCDQRMLWLKEKYLQLYYEDSGCAGPTPAEAIRTFGGRKWTIESMSSSHQSLHAADPIFSKCANVTGGNAAGAVGGSGGSNSGGGGNFSKNRKKKSTVSLSVIRDHSTRSQLSITSEPESRQNSPRSSRSQHQSPQSSYRLHSPSKSADAAASIAVGTIIESENVYDSQSSLSVQSTSSCELTKNANVFDCSPIHTSLLTFNYREKFCKRNQLSLLDSFGSSGSNKMQQQQQRQHQQQSSTVPGRKAATSADTSAAAPSRNSKHKTHATAITHSTNMDFIEFSNLFRSFLVCIRRDIKDIFEQIASKSDIHTFLEAESNYFEEKYAKQEKTTLSNTKSKKESTKNRSKFLGLLTRNSDSELNDDDYHKCRIFDAIARASIVTNSAGINTLKTSLLLDTDFYVFITTYQCETITLEEVRRLIAQHEPNPILCQRGCLSFEGFARYLMDKNNFAYTPELSEICTEDMDHPLSHYYMASSHNTYLTGHQLKGESSVELYSQVLLTGCRCVELDCWDGEDGMPLIYHGHTFTSKIPFKKVVETINEKAFVASPYPVILSVENHCSLQQQAKMAQIFLQVFGDKLVTKFLFDSDYCDEPQLPSPNQLKYRILIKNKKLRAPLHPSVHLRSRSAIPSVSKIANGRTNSLVSNVSIGSLNDDDDDEYDDEDDEDDVDDSALQSANMLDSIDSTKKTEDGGGSGEMATVTKKSFNSSSKSGKSSLHPSEQSHHSLETDNHQISGSPYVQNSKIVRKSSSQIAPELSDLVIYSQAIKFRGLLSSAYNLSPTGSAMGTPISKKLASRKALSSATFNSTIQASASLLPVIESNKIRDELRELNTASPTLLVTTTATLTTTATAPASTTIVTTFSSTSASASASTTAANTNINKRPNSSAPCYQISSINENTAKKLCRKSPLTVIAHTENQIMRTYPARMRIDSSNFNPVIFWAFGIQSVALNYQTVDSALHINSAMFEQNGGCGYVLKTSAMRDKSHLMFGRFNPYEKEFDGLHTITLTFTVISGQYVCPNTNTGSPLVEMEIIGIPVDTCRQRTKIVQRNSLNPIWNDTFFFRIKFVDLAFLRITVMDMGANHLAAQRIVPLKCLKQGYRHLRLHSPQNQNLPLSTLFIYSCFEEEGLDIEHESDKMKLKNKMISKIDLNRFEGNKSEGSAGTAPVKRRMFFLMVHGVMPEEPSTILKITQESTAADVISQALTKANKANENVNDYVLLEEVSRGWEKKRMSERNTITQRLLDPSERPLEAQSNWKGEGRFVLKKMADDPSTRAWMTSIRSSSSNKDRLKREDATYTSAEEAIADWEAEPENETFLVCIYNVSQDQPYTILKSSVTSSSQDIITQALLKAHRDEDPKSFVIIEEAENFGDANTTELSSSFSFKSKTGTGYRRVLDDNENIYVAQTQWKNKGKFELKYRKEVTANDNTYIKTSTSSASAKLLRGRGSFKKLSQLHRSYSKRLQQRKDCSESPPASNRKSYNNCATTCDVGSSGSPSIKSNESPQPIRERKNENDLELKKQKEQKNAENDETRQAHSEGEMPSDSEEKSKDSSVGSLTRLKKLSLKRLKVWKS